MFADRHRGKAETGRRKRPVRAAVLASICVLVAMAAAALLSGQYQVRPVLSGSMRPGLPIGGLVVTQRVPTSSLQIRDVIVFHPPGRPDELVVHRIVAMESGPDGPVVKTQGDANSAPDPWRITLHGPNVYRAAFSVPLLGYVSVWMHSPTGRRVLIAVGLLLVVAAAIGRPRRFRRPAPDLEREEQPASAEVTAATAVVLPGADMAAGR